MRRRTTATIVGAGAALLAVCAWLVADVQGLLPSVLTLPRAPMAAAPPRPVSLDLALADPAATDAPALAPAAVAAVWAPTRDGARARGWRPWASVIDLATGDVLLDEAATTPHTTASTLKILTAANALAHLDPASTLDTSLHLAGNDLDLVCTGDLLLADGAGDADEVRGRAGLADLASAAAAELGRRGIGAVTLHEPAPLFSGAARVPAWDRQDVAGWEGDVAPCAIDSGHLSDEETGFSRAPGHDVAEALAEHLRGNGLDVTLAPARPDATGGEEIARIASAPVGEQLGEMLAVSDNTMADQYCRLAARAAGSDTSAEGAVTNLLATLSGLGVDTAGIRLDDCSGLSSDDAVTGLALTTTLRLAAHAQRPALRDLPRLLPWAGLDGTVANRMAEIGVAGRIRAKTGTLGSASALAGVVETGGGRLLLVSAGVDSLAEGDTLEARDLLDVFFVVLARQQS